MLEAEGVVVEVGSGDALVETSRISACGSCSSSQGCATTTLSRLLGGKVNLFQVSNPIGAVVGDRVVVGLDESALLRSSAVLYLVPLALMLLGAFIGNALSPLHMRDLVDATGATLGLLVGFFSLRRLSAGLNSRPAFRPVILRHVLPSKVVGFGVMRKG